ncbi:MAG: hypothetical protein QT01_C0008G0033 [archaeon GW2011_AR6]|nr:MAG: hypothetical protein QT01_C0008G0033 [archaeon GW2011_AR6]
MKKVAKKSSKKGKMDECCGACSGTKNGKCKCT